MEFSENTVLECYIRNLNDEIHKISSEWTPQDFLIFIQMVELDPLLKKGINTIEKFKEINEGNFRKFTLTKILFKKIASLQTFLENYDSKFEIPEELSPKNPNQTTPFEEKCKYDAQETCVLIEYEADKSQYPIPSTGGKFGRNFDNDIVLSDKDVSRKHAEIFFLENKFFLKDLKSSVGTSLLIQEPILLEKGMMIEIGTIYKIKIEEIVGKKVVLRIENDDDYENEKAQELDFGSIGRKKPIVIGQGESCQIRLQAGKKIAEQHCKIYLNERNQIVVEDLKSKFGTWIVLDKIPKEMKPKMRFKLGDNNIFNVKQIFIIQKSNVYLLPDENCHEESKGSMENEDLCIICCDNPKNGTLMPCKHNFMCVKCCQGLQTCPMCRMGIESILEINK